MKLEIPPIITACPVCGVGIVMPVRVIEARRGVEFTLSVDTTALRPHVERCSDADTPEGIQP